MVSRSALRAARFLLCTLLFFFSCGYAYSGAFKYRLPSPGDNPKSFETVVGGIQYHTVSEKETLLDIARNYELGFNEVQLLYPLIDPWIPEAGTRLVIPTMWILPATKKEGIVINLPELRLYRFFPKIKMVKTYPIGIGDLGWETPEGAYRVIVHEVNPTWRIPLSLREKYGRSYIPPGPENPLGEYWIGLSRKGYGIHGTNFPWGVGRLVSHGCIRLYPEHISRLFTETPVGTPVEIIYEPIKVGFRQGEIFLEVHPDPYGKIVDLKGHARTILRNLGLLESVSEEKVNAALLVRNGVPFPIGIKREGDAGASITGRVFSEHYRNSSSGTK